MPIPRPSAGSTASGIEMMRIRTKIAASAPSARTTRLSGTDGGSSNPDSRSATSARTASADEEDELAEDAGVPADHGELHADARAGVPAHERREREDEPGDPGDALAGGPEAAAARPGVARPGAVSRGGRLEIEEVRGFHGAKYGQHSGRQGP